MSKQASTRLIVLEPSEDLIASEPWSVDTYAEGLMDELFADIDHILDGRGNLPNQKQQQARDWNSSARRTDLGDMSTVLPSEYAPLQTVTVSPITLPETQRQSVQLPQTKNKQFKTFPARKRVSKRKKLLRTVGKLLFLLAILGLVIPAVVWIVNSGVLNRLTTKSYQNSLLKPHPQANLQPSKTQVEADLVDYMLGSLAAIDRQETSKNQNYAQNVIPTLASANHTALAYINQKSTINLPPPIAANHQPPTPSHSTKVVERIYIPVYQAPSPMRYTPPSIVRVKPLSPIALAPAKTSSKPKVVKTALNTAPKPAKPVNVSAPTVLSPQKSLVLQTAPVTVKQLPKPLPAAQVVSPRVAPAAKPDPSPTEQQVVAVLSPSIAPTQTLEGLLELGDKSAALFKIDGVTHRVTVGENIGISGWTLVDVAKGEAIVRRNGEVRSIYTGQKF